MLSFIYQQADKFEQKHGVRPNLLYLNQVHAEQLQACFSELHNLEGIKEMLQMEIIINQDIPHPHMAWAPTAHRRAS